MIKEFDSWLKQALRDLVTAQHDLTSKDYYAGVFWCQQAVEKSLKALYIKRKSDVIKIHDLVKLAREVEAPPEIISNCTKINPVYLAVRYPESDELPSELVTREKADQILILAREVVEWAQKKLC